VRVSQATAILSLVLLVLVLTACHRGVIPAYWDIPAGAIVGLVLVAHLASPGSPQSALSRLLALRWTVQIGVLSYSIYLWHLPLVVVARNVMGLNPWLTALIVVPVTLLLASLTRIYLEIPAARLKERWVRPSMTEPDPPHARSARASA
jgi:peptidoglycan/LPS O-acetylase OafA/YrhL